ncbi:hypothetical protein VNI00_001377 [Paramarasmius palmivorus]|uniref:Uncharacterized protein n=1 Tax=Paramarasmius palmivorus TaxID=297713 RepID=A0AAW0E8A8_9AGAR
MTPWQIVVAGSSPYGYLFDRRYTSTPSNGVTTCVRRFGRPPNTPDRDNDGRMNLFHREHITGARCASENGWEVLLSYSGDGVYLYSTLDDPEDGEKRRKGTVLPRNKVDVKRRRLSNDDQGAHSSSSSAEDDEGEHDQDEEESDDDMDEDNDNGENFYPEVPTILPRMRYAGARNVDTVKDVNFLGPFDSYVVSGSDDGNWFMWDKSNADLKGVYEGDGSVVNVIEGHPWLPIVAVSGIDKTVKIFGPCKGESSFSRMSEAENIIRNNQDRNTLRTFRTIRRADFISLLAALHDEEGEGRPECVNQ